VGSKYYILLALNFGLNAAADYRSPFNSFISHSNHS